MPKVTYYAGPLDGAVDTREWMYDRLNVPAIPGDENKVTYLYRLYRTKTGDLFYVLDGVKLPN